MTSYDKTPLTVENMEEGLIVFNGSILGSLVLLVIEHVFDNGAFSTRRLDGFNSKHSRYQSRPDYFYILSREDAVNFLSWHWLTDQAFRIILDNSDNLGLDVYRQMLGQITLKVLDTNCVSNWANSKDKVKVGKYTYKVITHFMNDGYNIFEYRGWSKDRQWNGESWYAYGEDFEAVKNQRLTRREALIEAGLWFDDSEYIDQILDSYNGE